MVKKEKLLEKGWAAAEAEHAEQVTSQNRPHDAHFSKIVFWTSLVITVIGNIFVSLVLVPFLVVLNAIVLYSLVAVLGLIIGSLYSFLISDVAHLGKTHHVSAGIIIPLLALGNVAAMVLLSNRFIVDLGVENPLHNPWITAGIFAVAFIVPYLVDLLRGKFR